MTLIEILLTLVILSSVIVVVIQSFLTSMRASKDSLTYHRAILLFDNTLTDLLLRRSGRLTYEGRNTFAEPFRSYRYSVRSAPKEMYVRGETFDDTVTLSLDEISVDITWPGGRGQQTLTAGLYLSEPPEAAPEQASDENGDETQTGDESGENSEEDTTGLQPESQRETGNGLPRRYRNTPQPPSGESP